MIDPHRHSFINHFIMRVAGSSCLLAALAGAASSLAANTTSKYEPLLADGIGTFEVLVIGLR